MPLRTAVSALGLEFNNKTQVIPLKNGVDYLGFHLYLTANGKVLRKVVGKKRQALKRRIDRCFTDYECGLLTVDELTQRLISYDAHLRYGHTYGLRRTLWGRWQVE